jgi:hypothetical protein
VHTGMTEVVLYALLIVMVVLAAVIWEATR